MSVFNENGTLIYASNGANVDSVYSYIESTWEIDKLYANLESEINAYNMSFEILSESLNLNILNEESFKEKASKAGSTIKNFFIKIGETIKNAFLSVIDGLSKLPVRKAVISPNKNKIKNNFKDLISSGGGNELVAEYKNLKILASKGYNKCSKNFNDAVTKIKKIWDLGPEYIRNRNTDDELKRLGAILIGTQFDLENYKNEIHEYLFGIDQDNGGIKRTISSLNIDDIINHALGIDNDIKSLKINVKTMDNFMKEFNKSDVVSNENASKYMKTAFSILHTYSVYATKSIRDVSSACIKLCLDLNRGTKNFGTKLKNKSIGNTNDYYDKKPSKNNNENTQPEEQESEE